MPRLYYHHIAQKGLEHLTQTVYQQVEASILARTLSPEVYERVAESVQQSFPGGTFNCWGAPAPAVSVMSKMTPGDFVLLVERGGEDGEIPALCEVKVVVPGPQSDLSRALWGSRHYPLIYLFDAELLELRWMEFLDHMGYPHTIIPMGNGVFGC